MHIADVDLTWSRRNKPLQIIDRQAGVVFPQQRSDRRRVCIYGAGVGRNEAPLDSVNWEVWAINTVPPFDNRKEVRADLWWDIHQKCAQSEDDLRWFRSIPVPIMTTEDMLDVSPRCVRYPMEYVRETTEAATAPYACTFALQLAYAYSVGIRDIGLFGVELCYGTVRERTVEWASVNWWLGFLEARGVTIYLPRKSRMGLHPFVYGLDYQAEIKDVKEYEALLRSIDRQQPDRASVGG